ncbi:hypothetical protein C8Q75DRAFT_448615 [Abortiporus biennis]|nr:hypothetical protein C8Q75DRAFT_448615 [Abortiporus biennis]
MSSEPTPSVFEEGSVPERVRSPPPAYAEQAGPPLDPESALAVQLVQLVQQEHTPSDVHSGSPPTAATDPIAPPLANRDASIATLPNSTEEPLVVVPRTIPANPPPIVLTWSPTSLNPGQTTDNSNSRLLSRRSIHGLRLRDAPSPTRTGLTTSPLQPSNVIPRGIMLNNPIQATVLNEPVLYTFSSISMNAMILVPPATHPDTSPVYHISWREDYFRPGSFITTIRRGGNENGRYVGEFDLRNNTRVGSVRIGNVEKWVDDVAVVTSKSRGSTTWKFSSNQLFWDRGRRMAPTNHRFCRLHPESNEWIAQFIPPNPLLRNLDAQICKLEVSPLGLKHFDEIILSSLLMERQKVTGAGPYAIIA